MTCKTCQDKLSWELSLVSRTWVWQLSWRCFVVTESTSFSQFAIDSAEGVNYSALTILPACFIFIEIDRKTHSLGISLRKINNLLQLKVHKHRL